MEEAEDEEKRKRRIQEDKEKKKMIIMMIIMTNTTRMNTVMVVIMFMTMAIIMMTTVRLMTIEYSLSFPTTQTTTSDIDLAETTTKQQNLELRSSSWKSNHRFIKFLFESDFEIPFQTSN